jgi:hypothetical protein
MFRIYKIYEEEPKRGNAKKIWDTLKQEGLIELHYNPNNFGRNKIDGWGVWSATFIDGSEYWVCIQDNYVVIINPLAPYNRKYLKLKS